MKEWIQGASGSDVSECAYNSGSVRGGGWSVGAVAIPTCEEEVPAGSDGAETEGHHSPRRPSCHQSPHGNEVLSC